jgi:hypothetical protein
MDPEMNTCLILSIDECEKLKDKVVKTKIIFEEIDKVYISFFSEESNSGNEDRNLKISIPISVVITAYARIHMSYFKNLPVYILYYSDTDSI